MLYQDLQSTMMLYTAFEALRCCTKLYAVLQSSTLFKEALCSFPELYDVPRRSTLFHKALRYSTYSTLHWFLPLYVALRMAPRLFWILHKLPIWMGGTPGGVCYTRLEDGGGLFGLDRTPNVFTWLMPFQHFGFTTSAYNLLFNILILLYILSIIFEWPWGPWAIFQRFASFLFWNLVFFYIYRTFSNLIMISIR